MEKLVKNILITGPFGYIGSKLIQFLKENFIEYSLYGFDTNFFIDDCLFTSNDNLFTKIYKGDVRDFDEKILKNIDTIIHLAAISNDPISNQFESVTYDINYLATINLAKKAKRNGVKNFIFASSCSVYGYSENGEVNELSKTNPITPYAKSKLAAENDLEKLADSTFKVTCLRFATACGMSERLRLDLVLNDFVVSAYLNKKIEILSDGTPWRPLIDVTDMARAFAWSINRIGDEYLIVNVGNSKNNYQVKDLAQFVKREIIDTEIIINKNALTDKRSYKVNFDKFEKLSGNFYSKKTINESIKEIINGLNQINFNDYEFRKSNLIRLNKLNFLKKQNLINNNLEWI